MACCMTFPATFEEFAEDYKIVDSQEVYTNGTELIPIFRVKQWLQHEQACRGAKVKRGEWILSSDGYYPFCSNCRYEPPFVGGKDMRTPYCPNCGAKMDGGRKNDGKG